MSAALLCPPCTGFDRPMLRVFKPRLRLKRRGRIPLPPCPTNALPGTREKVAVLAERVRMGVALWHPDDAAYENALLLG